LSTTASRGASWRGRASPISREPFGFSGMIERSSTPCAARRQASRRGRAGMKQGEFSVHTLPTSAPGRRDREDAPVDSIAVVSEADREFLYTRTPPLAGLVASIREIGILEPLILSPGGKLICGVHRLLAAREAGLARVPVVRVPVARQAFLDGLWENLGHRAWTTIERVEIIARLSSVAGAGRDELLSVYLPAIGVGPSPALLDTYVALGRLPLDVKELPLRESHFLLLADLTGDDARALAALFASLAPSAGEARDLRNLLEETARRERTSVAAVAGSEGVAAIVRLDSPPRLRVGELRRILRGRALPALARIEEEARAIAAACGLSGHAAVKLPPNLEGGEIEIAFRVRSPRDFSDALSALSTPEARAGVRRILGLLRGERAR
jgi:hypothetical protein